MNRSDCYPSGLNSASPLARLGCRAPSNRLLAALPVALAFLLVLVVSALAQTLTFPQLTGRVVDAANILSPAAREQLDAKLKAHDDKTSDQVVVATVPSLQGTSIEDYANQLFRNWKLGQAKTNNGALILVAPNERKVRIEVGYGLEGTLTDAVSKMIIQAAIAPKFKQGDFAGGLTAGADAVIATLQGDGEWQERAKVRPSDQGDSYDPMAILLFIIIVIIIINIMASRAQQGGGKGGGQAHRRNNGNWIIIPSSGSNWGGGGGGWGGGFGGGGGGFSGGGGSSGGGGASGDW